MGTLTPVQTGRLEELEAKIEVKIRDFLDVGALLTAIREEKLYAETDDSFTDYCTRRWGFTRRRALQYMEAAEVVGQLEDQTGTSGSRTSEGTKVLPTSERVARELAKVPKEKRPEVWKEASKDGQPTAAKVREVANAEEPQTDDEGQPVPKGLADVFAAASEFEDHARTLTKIQKWAEEVAEQEQGFWFHAQSFVADLNNAKQALRFNKPYAVCPYCQAKKKNCDACKGHGFVSKGIYKAAPAEMRI